MNQPHGNYNVNVKDNIIHIRFSGSFNENCTNDLFQEIKSVIKYFKEKGILILSDLSTFQGATPDAYYISEKYNQWLNTKNLIAKAIVFHSTVVQDINLSRVQSLKEQNIKYFDNESNALAWLNSYKTSNLLQTNT